MRRMTTAVVLACASAAFGQDAMYGIDFPGSFYKINLATGAGQFIGFTGFDRLNSAAMNSAGEIYTTRIRDFNLPGDTNKLIRVDPATGAGTLVATLAIEHDIRALAFNSQGNLFGLMNDVGDLDMLVEINPVSGAVTAIGSTGKFSLQGLTSTPDDELYAVEIPNGVVYRIDPASGASTLIGGAVGFDNQSIEYTSGTKAVCGRSNLVEVDLVTGASTMIGPMGIPDLRGLAGFKPTGGNECYPDCDGDSALTIDDFICFQTLFALGDPYADCDGDGSGTIDDFICFQTLFAIGC